MDLISLLVWILVFACVAWAGFWIIGQMGLPAPINMVARVILGLILLLVLLSSVGGYFPLPHFRR